MSIQSAPDEETNTNNHSIPRWTSSAGSDSHRVDGFRQVHTSDAAKRMSQLLTHFPHLGTFLNRQSVIINAYPATLGLEGVAPVFDSFLNPDQFTRYLRKAAYDSTPTVLTAQPLVGADFLLRYCQYNYRLPEKVLWATGGYYLPASLEKFMKRTLESRNCELVVLHCYGAAEVGHTCFAAVDRFDNLLPRFHLVADEVDPSISEVPGQKGQLVLTNGAQSVCTGDQAEKIGASHWQISSGPERLSKTLRETFESWSGFDWSRRTGYVRFDPLLHKMLQHGKHVEQFQMTDTLCYQLRESVCHQSSNELLFHEFWQRFGGGVTCKPNWNEKASSVR